MALELGPQTAANEILKPYQDDDADHEPDAGRPPRNRGRRQIYTFATLFVVVLLVGLVAAGNFLHWWTIGGTARASAATLCPAQGTADPADVGVNVYNSTARVGLAATVGKSLQGRSFQVMTIANAPGGTVFRGTAEIVYGRGGWLAAHTLLLEVPHATLVADPRDDASVDLVLGRKYRALAGAKRAAAAIAHQRAPSGCVAPDPATPTTPAG